MLVVRLAWIFEGRVTPIALSAVTASSLAPISGRGCVSNASGGVYGAWGVMCGKLVLCVVKPIERIQTRFHRTNTGNARTHCISVVMLATSVALLTAAPTSVRFISIHAGTITLEYTLLPSFARIKKAHRATTQTQD